MFSEYENETKIKPPEVFVLSSGEITPFRLSISPKQDKDKGWFIDGKESGEIELSHARDLLDEANTE
jgi:general secretion pathway protein H